ncbi:MobC family plasmid mobilization relaxosome protein [Bifidobacterium pseudolongum]|uniref:MobC family plasmid mobilization relaxosome protein n=1 Tax=Bifidobacterium pseudolongum TaxID=1694 RepID=A0A4S4FCK9_9BIFI|nr:MobC family plasmid mobilization relaxosome protein [Bifidobacterium pseudolongum]THG27302.1 MobC family plasmid mobilization relaxosome protein [Bifidobacterium pseudolongum]
MSWSPGRRRNVQKLLTFTPEEWEQVDANWTACATDPRYERFADFARAALTRTQIRVIEVPPSPMAIRGEVRRIGININELTHLANRTGTVSDAVLEEAIDALERVDALIERLADEHERALADVWQED